MSAVEGAIIAAFDAAATTYDAASGLQRQVARQLVANAAVTPPRSILDIGCGTGHVTALAASRWPRARLTALDASPAMLEETRKKVPHVRTLQGNAATLKMAEKFDLVTSSMLLHWLPRPCETLRRWRKLLAPNGRLLVALPIEGSLGEWRDVCHAARLQDGAWAFPKEDFASGLAASSTARAHQMVYESVQAFLKSMKTTGAHTSRRDHFPTPVRMMRELLRNSPRPFSITYKIQYLLLEGAVATPGECGREYLAASS